jgi:hypothetical protein
MRLTLLQLSCETCGVTCRAFHDDELEWDLGRALDAAGDLSTVRHCGHVLNWSLLASSNEAIAMGTVQP